MNDARNAKPVETMRMTGGEIAFFTEEIGLSTSYLEYGSGGSTKLAVRQASIKNMTSVESDPAFLDAVVLPDPEIQKAIADSRLRFLLPDIGPTRKSGVPKDSTAIHLWPNYALCPYLHGSAKPDLILVDGRFRVACCLAATLQAPAAAVLVHDYTLRRHYHVLENYFEIEKQVDTLVKLRRSENFNARSARNLLKKYLYSPCDDRQTPHARFFRFLSNTRRSLKRRWKSERD